MSPTDGTALLLALNACLWLVIGVGVTLIWQKGVIAMHIIVIKLCWHHLNLPDGQKIAKPSNKSPPNKLSVRYLDCVYMGWTVGRYCK